MTKLRLRKRDKQLLWAVTAMCRACNPSDVARCWGTTLANAMRRIQQLADHGFLNMYIADLPQLSPPRLFASGPPHWAVSPGRIAYRLRKHAQAHSWRRAHYCTATPKTAASLALALPPLCWSCVTPIP